MANVTYIEAGGMATTVSAAKAKAEFAECIRKAEAGARRVPGLGR